MRDALPKDAVGHWKTDLKLSLQVFNLILEAVQCLSALSPSIAEVHGGLAGQGIDGAGPAQDPNLAGALPAEACGAEGHSCTLLLLDIEPL